MTLTAHPLRVVVTGSEGTGKTTLTRTLAARFGAPWVPEFARSYAETIGRPLDASDVELIAAGQMVLEDSVLRSRQRLTILDTDLLSTLVYAQHYYGAGPAWLNGAVRERLADLYLLADIDVEWQPDGVRDQPHGREEIQNRFRDQLRAFNARVADVRGSAESRVQTAVRAVEDLLREL